MRIAVIAPHPDDEVLGCGGVMARHVAAGDEVQAGQGLVVVEAMKMENAVTSPCAGRVLGVKVAQGETVESGAPLVVIR